MLCALAPWAAAETSVQPDLPRETAAIVNGESIPRQLVDVFLKNDREALGLTAKTEEERKQLASLPAAILDELIDRAIIAQETRRRGIEPTDAQLDADEQRLITFCGSEARYAAYTAQSGFNRQEYRERVLRTAANGEAMIKALTGDLVVPEEEIASYYDAHRAESDFQTPERVTGEHILIGAQRGQLMAQLEHTQGLKPDAPGLEEALAQEISRRSQLAQSVREQAAAPGADFAALARKYSDDLGTRDRGGSLTTFAHGVHPVALDDAFFALAPGAVGPVVRTDFGFHVIRVTARLPAGQKKLAEATPEIRQRLLREKSARRSREWLAAARAKSAIVLRDSHDLPEGR